MSHHAAGSDDAVVADGDTGEHFHAAAEPDIVAHVDGLCGFGPGGPQLGIQGMQGGVEATLRGDFYIIAEGDLARIHENAVVVGKETVARFHVFAEAEEHRGLHIGILAQLAENLPQDPFSAFHIGRLGVVIFPAQIGAADVLRFPFRCSGVVQKPCGAIFPPAHRTTSNCSSGDNSTTVQSLA